MLEEAEKRAKVGRLHKIFLIGLFDSFDHGVALG